MWLSMLSPLYCFFLLFYKYNVTINMVRLNLTTMIKDKKINYSWTSLCRSGRDPEKYFDIGMVRLNQMGIWVANIFAKVSVFKRMLTFKHILLPFKLISFIGEYKKNTCSNGHILPGFHTGSFTGLIGLRHFKNR